MRTKETHLRWSVKENDWTFKYPDNKGKSLATIFFDMLKVENNLPFVDGKTLKELLTERGYDYKSFKITVDKIK